MKPAAFCRGLFSLSLKINFHITVFQPEDIAPLFGFTDIALHTLTPLVRKKGRRNAAPC
jgi:hypothetical protein